MFQAWHLETGAFVAVSEEPSRSEYSDPMESPSAADAAAAAVSLAINANTKAMP